MRRIAVAAATIAVTAGVLFTAAPAQADEPGTTSETSSTKVIHHRFQLHYLDRDPHMAPRGMTHSVRHAHRPGTG
ncbi:hypothetical protein H7J08_16805 [Mycobacterium frederiksbergense]|jgi:hypothetical protein|uniref:hypothetical protein n=1 Tax=Mycolicibacterium frederiksbergense TaxID=117567 RepID=UPI0021F3C1CC|nr:hypothetical protein [Mycolicibacterium frederiksbergense]MBX9918998.1 hypothetical protein [Mycolicibacterium frederiksbergense]MCV7046315.1 hypothetical protein [Mycolicibacterium frederiksbergense]